MNILILEDEPLAVQGIEQILNDNFSDLGKVDHAQSLSEGKDRLTLNELRNLKPSLFPPYPISFHTLDPYFHLSTFHVNSL